MRPKDVSEDWPIAIKPIVFSGLLWGRLWQEKLVLAQCDNLAGVQEINYGYCKDPRIMHHLRCLFLIAAHFEFILKAAHISGKLNIAADAICRNNLPLFHSQIPEANTLPSSIPQAVVSLVIYQQPDWFSQSWFQLFNNCFQQELHLLPIESTPQEHTDIKISPTPLDWQPTQPQKGPY